MKLPNPLENKSLDDSNRWTHPGALLKTMDGRIQTNAVVLDSHRQDRETMVRIITDCGNMLARTLPGLADYFYPPLEACVLDTHPGYERWAAGQQPDVDSVYDGGPAFPVSTRPHEKAAGYGHQDSASTWQYGGMSLRDWFAGQCMAESYSENLHYGTQESPCNPWPHIAKDCYAAADAMLAEREKGGGEDEA